MKPRNFLYSLIRSLDKGEVMRVKGDLERTGSEVSLFLFELFQKSEKDDYYAVKNDFEKKYPNFSSAYDWLKKRILYALTDFRLSDEPTAKLGSAISQIRFLTRKGLNQEALRLLNRAKQTATMIEDFGQMIDLLELQRHILSELSPPKKHPELWKQYEVETVRIQAQQNTLAQLKMLLAKLQIETAFRSPQEVLAEVKVSPLIRKENIPDSLRSQIVYYRIAIKIARMERRHDDAISLMEIMIEICTSNPQLLVDPDLRELYSKCLSACGLFLADGGRYEESLVYVDQLKQLHTDSTDTATLLRHWVLLIFIASKRKDTSAGMKIVRKVSTKIQSLESRINPGRLLTLYYSISEFLFFSEEYEKCGSWVGKIYAQSNPDYMPEVVAAGKLLFLIIEYERGDFEAVDNGFRHVRYFLRKHGYLDSMVRAFFRLLQALINADSSKDTRELFYDFQKHLQENHTKGNSISPWRDFEILDVWIESKLSPGSLFDLRDTIKYPRPE